MFTDPSGMGIWSWVKKGASWTYTKVIKPVGGAAVKVGRWIKEASPYIFRGANWLQNWLMSSAIPFLQGWWMLSERIFPFIESIKNVYVQAFVAIFAILFVAVPFVLWLYSWGTYGIAYLIAALFGLISGLGPPGTTYLNADCEGTMIIFDNISNLANGTLNAQTGDQDTLYRMIKGADVKQVNLFLSDSNSYNTNATIFSRYKRSQLDGSKVHWLQDPLPPNNRITLLSLFGVENVVGANKLGETKLTIRCDEPKVKDKEVWIVIVQKLTEFDVVIKNDKTDLYQRPGDQKTDTLQLHTGKRVKVVGQLAANGKDYYYVYTYPEVDQFRNNGYFTKADWRKQKWMFVEKGKVVDVRDDAQLLTFAKSSVCPNELRMLAAVTYSEIGGGQVSEIQAVAHSILNRRDDDFIFPKDLAEVIIQEQEPGSPHGQYRGYRENGVISSRYTRGMTYYSTGNTTVPGEVNAMTNSLRESVKAYYKISKDNTNGAGSFNKSNSSNMGHNHIRSVSNIPSNWLHSFWIHSGPCPYCAVQKKNP